MISKPSRIMGRDFLKRRNRALVTLNRNDMLRTKRQQGAGETSGSGTDFEYRHTGKRSGSACDTFGKIKIEEEVLAERFSRDEAVPANHIAQRRQTVSGAGHDAVRGARLPALARRAARRSAATRLAESARPVPAISKAVPWSGEVRTKGRPSVTFTA